MYYILFSYIIYFVIMYMIHIILDFNPIRILNIALKYTLTSFKFYFMSSRLIL